MIQGKKSDEQIVKGLLRSVNDCCFEKRLTVDRPISDAIEQ